VVRLRKRECPSLLQIKSNATAQDILPRRHKGTKNKDKTERIDSWNILLKVVTTQHPLDFVLWQGARSAESVAYGLYVSIRASQQRR